MSFNRDIETPLLFQELTPGFQSIFKDASAWQKMQNITPLSVAPIGLSIPLLNNDSKNINTSGYD